MNALANYKAGSAPKWRGLIVGAALLGGLLLPATAATASSPGAVQADFVSAPVVRKPARILLSSVNGDRAFLTRYVRGAILGPNGARLPNASIEIYTKASSGSPWVRRPTVRTKSSGQFTAAIRNLAGSYQIRLRVLGSTRVAQTDRILSAPVRSWATSVALTSNPAARPGGSKTLTGVVLRSDRQPATAVRVQLQIRATPNSPWRLMSTTATDRNGSFRLTHPAAPSSSYQFRVSTGAGNGYQRTERIASAAVTPWTPQLTVTSNPQTRTGEAKVISGRFFLPSGYAVSGRPVQWLLSTNGGTYFPTGGSTTTQRDGSFTIRTRPVNSSAKVRIYVPSTTGMASFVKVIDSSVAAWKMDLDAGAEGLAGPADTVTTLSGTLTAEGQRMKNTSVYMQSRASSSDGWKTIGNTVTDADGAWFMSTPIQSAGGVQLRVIYTGDPSRSFPAVGSMVFQQQLRAGIDIQGVPNDSIDWRATPTVRLKGSVSPAYAGSRASLVFIGDDRADEIMQTTVGADGSFNLNVQSLVARTAWTASYRVEITSADPGRANARSDVFSIHFDSSSVIENTVIPKLLVQKINAYRAENGLYPFTKITYAPASDCTKRYAEGTPCDPSIGGYTGTYDDEGASDDMMDGWKNSPEHDLIVLGKKDKGIACYTWTRGDGGQFVGCAISRYLPSS
ncbi:MAG: hypothetical protein WKF57_03700 [Nakamurella sp.]